MTRANPIPVPSEMHPTSTHPIVSSVTVRVTWQARLGASAKGMGRAALWADGGIAVDEMVGMMSGLGKGVGQGLSASISLQPGKQVGCERLERLEVVGRGRRESQKLGKLGRNDGNGGAMGSWREHREGKLGSKLEKDVEGELEAEIETFLTQECQIRGSRDSDEISRWRVTTSSSSPSFDDVETLHILEHVGESLTTAESCPALTASYLQSDHDSAPLTPPPSSVSSIPLPHSKQQTTGSPQPLLYELAQRDILATESRYRIAAMLAEREALHFDTFIPSPTSLSIRTSPNEKIIADAQNDAPARETRRIARQAVRRVEMISRHLNHATSSAAPLPTTDSAISTPIAVPAATPATTSPVGREMLKCSDGEAAAGIGVGRRASTADTESAYSVLCHGEVDDAWEGFRAEGPYCLLVR